MRRTFERKITISPNPWRIPDINTAFEGVLAGRMTAAQRAHRLEMVKVARSNWQPTAPAYALVDDLRSLVGEIIEIQFWDPIMYWIEDEGPHPISGVLLDVLIVDVEGFPQAYVILDNILEIATPLGFSPTPYVQQRSGLSGNCASLASIYEIRQLRS